MIDPKNTKAVCLSISLPSRHVEALKKRLPKYGEVSKAVQLLIDKFLKDEIKLTIPARKL